jgi:hypothetical protein
MLDPDCAKKDLEKPNVGLEVEEEKSVECSERLRVRRYANLEPTTIRYIGDIRV